MQTLSLVTNPSLRFSTAIIYTTLKLLQDSKVFKKKQPEEPGSPPSPETSVRMTLTSLQDMSHGTRHHSEGHGGQLASYADDTKWESGGDSKIRVKVSALESHSQDFLFTEESPLRSPQRCCDLVCE